MSIRKLGFLLVWLVCSDVVLADYIGTRIDALQCIYDDEVNPGSCSEKESQRKSNLPITKEGVVKNALEDAEYVNATFDFSSRPALSYDKFDCSKIPLDPIKAKPSDYFERTCSGLSGNINGRSLTNGSFVKNGASGENKKYINSDAGYLLFEASMDEFNQYVTPLSPSLKFKKIFEDYGFSQSDISYTSFKYENEEVNESSLLNKQCIHTADYYSVSESRFYRDGRDREFINHIDVDNEGREGNVLSNTHSYIGASYKVLYPSPSAIKSRYMNFSVSRFYYCVDSPSDKSDLFTRIDSFETCDVTPIYENSVVKKADYNCSNATYWAMYAADSTFVPVDSSGITVFIPYANNPKRVRNYLRVWDLDGPVGSMQLNQPISQYGITCDNVNYSNFTYDTLPHEENGEIRDVLEIANLASHGGVIDNDAVNSLASSCADGIKPFSTFVNSNGYPISYELLNARVTYAEANPISFWTNVADYFEEQLNYKVAELNNYIKLLEGANDFDPEALKCISAQSMMASLGSDFIAYADNSSNGVNIDIWEEFPSVSSCSAYGNGRGWRYQDNPTEIENASWNYATFNESWTQEPYSAAKSLQLIQTADDLDGIVQSPTNKVSELIAEINSMLAPGSSLDQFLTLSRNYSGHLSTESCTDLAEAIVGVGPNQAGGMLSKLVEYQNEHGPSDENKLTNNIDISFSCP